MRIRTVKPEFWRDGDVAKLSRDARLLFIGIWNVADDWGFLEDDAETLRLTLFPGDRDVWESDVAAWVDELRTAGMLDTLIDDDERPLLRVVHFRRHQKIDRPSRPRFAVSLPTDADEAMPTPRTRREATRAADSKVPEDLDARLAAYVEPVRLVLAEIAAANVGAEEPTPGAVARALADYPRRDFLPVARDYRAWQLHGKVRRPHKDVVRGFRNQLDMASDVGRPEPAKHRARPSESNDDDKLAKAGL